jgi:aldehyde dehydrogenase (NAD+)
MLDKNTPPESEIRNGHGNGHGTKERLAPGPAAPLPPQWDYAPAPESTSEARIAARYELFIGGKFVAPRSKSYFKTINPATEEALSEIAEGGKEDVDLAVKAARQAYEKHWSKMKPLERGKYMFRFARMLREKARRLAVVESMNGGKPIKESRDVDIPLACEHFFYHAGWADKLQYAFPGRTAQSLGVCGQVIPWNFPLLMAAWKIAPALAAGNTVVLKPAETTPLTAMLLAETIQEAELPPGVVNIVTGGPSTGGFVIDHPDVNKVAFTGSTEVGKLIQRKIAGSGKRVTLELGGKAANIVFEDAPLDQAIEGIVSGIYFNQGHVCCAGSRLLVQESILEPLMRKLDARIRTLRLGDPMDKNTDIGAIHSRVQLDKIRAMVDAGQNEGADLHQAACTIPERGYWFAPSYFTNVGLSNTIAQEEIFGPVLSVLSFRTPEEAVARANNTRYGLSAGIWTEKGSRILKIAQKMRAGVVWANTYNKFDPTAPFGGYKESGFGREGGLAGLGSYVALT